MYEVVPGYELVAYEDNMPATFNPVYALRASRS